MHKLPQPVKLWYLSSFFRYESAAGRAATASSGRSAPRRSAPTTRPSTPRSIAAARRAARRRRRARRAPAPRSLGTPETRAAYRESCRPTCARTRTALVERGPRPHRPQPAARVRRRPPRHAGGHGAARRCCSTASTARTPSTSTRCARCSTPPTSPTSSTRRSCAGSTTTRARSSSSRPTRSARSRGVGGGGRYDGLVEQLGGPPTPGVGWAAGIERILLAAGERAAAGAAPRRPVRRLADARRAAARSRSPPRRAAPASPRRSSSAGRSLKGQLKQADRIGARFVAILGEEGSDAEGHGERASRRESSARADGRRARPARDGGRCEAAARRTRYRDAWAGALTREPRRRRTVARRRLGPPPPRPRRADLHRPARPLRDRAARLPPGPRAEALAAAAARCAPSTSSAPRGDGRRAASEGNVNPNLADRRDRAAGRRARRCSPTPRRRRSRSTRTAPVDEMLRLRHRTLDLRREPHARGARRCATRSSRAMRDDARRARLPRDRDADPDALDARGRARLPRAGAPAARASFTRCRSRRSCSSSC